jgi:hypothetical protein
MVGRAAQTWCLGRWPLVPHTLPSCAPKPHSSLPYNHAWGLVWRLHFDPEAPLCHMAIPRRSDTVASREVCDEAESFGCSAAFALPSHTGQEA